MDNFNCKQHLKCGEWKTNPNPFAISKGSIAHETKQKCHRKYAIERKNSSSWKILVEQSQWQFIESAITKYDECKQFASL